MHDLNNDPGAMMVPDAPITPPAAGVAGAMGTPPFQPAPQAGFPADADTFAHGDIPVEGQGMFDAPSTPPQPPAQFQVPPAPVAAPAPLPPATEDQSEDADLSKVRIRLKRFDTDVQAKLMAAYASDDPNESLREMFKGDTQSNDGPDPEVEALQKEIEALDTRAEELAEDGDTLEAIKAMRESTQKQLGLSQLQQSKAETAKRAVETRKQQSEAQFSTMVAESKQRVFAQDPSTRDPNSPIGREIHNVLAQMEALGDPALGSPDAPERIFAIAKARVAPVAPYPQQPQAPAPQQQYAPPPYSAEAPTVHSQNPAYGGAPAPGYAQAPSAPVPPAAPVPIAPAPVAYVPPIAPGGAVTVPPVHNGQQLAHDLFSENDPEKLAWAEAQIMAGL